MQSIFLSTNHLFLRDPRGGVEDVVWMRDAGFGAIFCNVGDHSPEAWATVRDRARNAGVVCGPWLRTTDTSGRFLRERVQILVGIAGAWGNVPFIVNSESELKGTGKTETEWLATTLKGHDWALSMETIPFANVEWWPLADVPVLPQLFRAIIADEETAVRNLWQQYGIKCVVMTYGAFGGSTPSQYSRLSPYGAYAGDDMGQRYSAWASIGTTKVCTDDGGDDVAEGKGAARSAQDAYDAWLESTAKPADWRRDNPGEWAAIQVYADADPGAPAPEARSATGRMLVALLEARRYADGTHA